MGTKPDTVPCTLIGILRRLWMSAKLEEEPKTIYILAKNDYKVHANIWFDRLSTAQFASVCDTLAGESFIRRSILRRVAWTNIQSIQLAIPVLDAKNLQVNICCVTNLFVDIGCRGNDIRFNVVKRLSIEVIGFNYCVEHFE